MGMEKEYDPNTQDDTETAKIRYTPVCLFCRHYDRSVKESDKHSCAAFPEGIPHEIWSGANDPRSLSSETMEFSVNLALNNLLL